MNVQVELKQEEELAPEAPLASEEQAIPMRWYVLQVHTSFENIVAATIREHVAKNEMLTKQIAEVLVPTEEVVEVRRGVKHKSKRKFFPGYVLIKANMNDVTRHELQNLPKVTGFLGTSDSPAPIRGSEEQRLNDQIREGVTRARPAVTFEVGEKVRVAHGPFSSFNGVVEDVDEDRARLKVSVSIFGRATPVDLEYSQVEKT